MKQGVTREIGRVGEDIACIFLERKGFSILERNFTRKIGEIDIIARKGSVLHFVEVKALSTNGGSREIGGDAYDPEDQVHEAKLKKIRRVADQYTAENDYDGEAQVDVVAVWLNRRAKRAKCLLYECVL